MRLRSALLATLTATSAYPAFAEEAADARSTIIVTGTRYTDPITTGSKTGVDPRDVPAAIVVIPEQVLRDQDVRSIDGALANASAVAPSFGGGYGFGDNFVIRGLPMRFLRDGLPDGPTTVGYHRTLADVASVEVLKGPGSALYGRAEAGGSVNLTSRTPADMWGINGLASYGSFDAITLTGDVTGPLADGANVRLIGNYERTYGYRGLSRRYIDVLPSVAVELGNHKITFDYDHRDQSAVVDNYGLPFTTALVIADIDPTSRFYSAFNRVKQVINRFTIADTLKARDDLTLRAALVYDSRTLNIRRNAGSAVINAAGQMTGRGGRLQTDRNDYWTGQAEAVWTPRTGSIQHTILLGAEYASSDLATVRRTYVLPNVSIVNGRADAPETITVLASSIAGFDRRITSDTLSVYAQEQIDLADTVKVRGGVRYDSVDLVDNGLVGAVARRIAGTAGLVSWQVGAVYKPAEWVSFYAGYAKGRFLALNTESTALSPIPESSSQIEAGMKTRLMDGKLIANFAAFETTRDDFFVTLVAGGDPVQVGAQKSRGVEIDVVGAPLPGLNIIGNVAYVDARNRSSALASVTGIATNQPVLGKRLGSTPEWSGSLWAAYEVQPGSPLAGANVGLGVVYKNAVFADQLELLRVPAYAVLRAALGYRTKHVDVQVTVNNVANARYYTVPTGVGAQVGDPRSVQVTLRTRF
jgi:iron complex outermembrane recepter protein